MASSRGSRRHSGGRDGDWGATEPAHAATLAARLRELQAEMRVDHEAAEAVVALPRRSRPTPKRALVRAVRVRIGHLLVNLGAFVEGSADCPDGASTVTRGA